MLHFGLIRGTIMKKVLAAVLTTCTIGTLLSPAGDAVAMALRANTEAASANLTSSGIGSVKEESASEGGSFDESIQTLYDSSMYASDEEVLKAAENMTSDFDIAEESLGEDAQDVINYVKFYEASKSRYLTREDDEISFAQSITDEWDRQDVYTSYVVGDTDDVHTLVPRVKITACETIDEVVNLDVYEWMTVGYGADDIVNASAYGYNFSLALAKGENGSWYVNSIYDTDQNFDWMEEEALDALEAQAALSENDLVTSADGQTSMMAASSVVRYSYNRDAAIKYGDTYALNYNLSVYNSYKGKGGDCANFVSQCLYAGGFPTDSTWYKHSVAWINVMRQIKHFSNYGTFLTADNGNILKGNPVYFDWNGDGTWDHATICVGRNSNGIAIIDSHTRDLYHSVYSYASYKKLGTIQLRDSGSATATSVSGSWQKNSIGWWYKNADGSYPKSTFQSIGGKTYYFDSNGYMKAGWLHLGEEYYYFGSDGVMSTGFVKVGSSTYYFGSDGVMVTGWKEISGSWYHFMSGGSMNTAWFKEDGKWYHFSSDGKMETGWVTVGSKKYYMETGGVMQTGWKKIDNNWYYFGTDGAMTIGWLSISGATYYFDTKGVMLTGKQTIGGATYTFDSNGRLKGSVTYVDSDSKTSASSGTSSSTAVVKSGLIEESGKTYYYVNNKKQTGWQTISGEKYYFDTDGGMVTGFKKIGEKTYYFQEKGKSSSQKEDGILLVGWKRVNGKKYYFDAADGHLHYGWIYVNDSNVKGWFFLDRTAGYLLEGWQKIDGSWYYLTPSTYVMKTGWLTLGSYTYYLDGSGKMVTGTKTIDGKTYTFASSGALVK